jgi:hypothetical protein
MQRLIARDDLPTRALAATKPMLRFDGENEQVVAVEHLLM